MTSQPERFMPLSQGPAALKEVGQVDNQTASLGMKKERFRKGEAAEVMADVVP
jgi:hypothetical protein